MTISFPLLHPALALEGIPDIGQDVGVDVEVRWKAEAVRRRELNPSSGFWLLNVGFPRTWRLARQVIIQDCQARGGGLLRLLRGGAGRVGGARGASLVLVGGGGIVG